MTAEIRPKGVWRLTPIKTNKKSLQLQQKESVFVVHVSELYFSLFSSNLDDSKNKEKHIQVKNKSAMMALYR